MSIFSERVSVLREKMRERGIDAYIILTDDFHASEYVNQYFKCRAYISGFTGSAGTLLVMQDTACLWTDGRYFLQAAQQLEGSGIELMKMGNPGVPMLNDYLAASLRDGAVIAYDGRTVNAGFAGRLKRSLSAKKLTYIENIDLVGEIWTDRPAFPAAPIWELSAKYTGKTRVEKLCEVRSEMAKCGADTFLLAALDDIAWLFNLRGDDVAFNPVFMSYSLISEDNAVIYADPNAFTEELTALLLNEGVCIKPYLQVYEDIKTLSGKLLLDYGKVNVALLGGIPAGVKIINKVNPTTVFKAIKTETEMENIRKAHIQDGVAVTKHMYWLRQMEHNEEYLCGRLTELDVSAKLLSFREERPGFIYQSFRPIIAAGAHGAIVHYSVNSETNAVIEKDNFILMDTGGQYYEGTTDITRTVSMGELSYDKKQSYTAVLRGNLRLAAARFRYGITGSNLDAIAREPLWELGYDFNHGTGHGVGYLLNVHEGPQRIRPSTADGSDVKFEHGMLTSDEPGVYLEGRYGIRLENLILCLADKETEFGKFMRFETVTMVPFDRRAILPEAMDATERRLLNEYHKKVYENISPYLTAEEDEWLRAETAEI